MSTAMSDFSDASPTAARGDLRLMSAIYLPRLVRFSYPDNACFADAAQRAVRQTGVR